MKEKIIEWLWENYGDPANMGEKSWDETAEGIMEWKIEERTRDNAYNLLNGIYGYDDRQAYSLIEVIQGK